MILFRSLTFLASNLFFILIGLLGINFLVGFHELGHFLFCKLFKIRTPTFSIGFGPFLASKKIGDTNFAFSAIPLGGYVEIAGSAEMGQGEQKDAHARDKHSFAVKPYYQKFLVLIGGILFNLIFAYFALILLFLIGLPKSEFLYPRNAAPFIKTIQPESAASKAGLVAGDRILSIDNQEIGDETLKAYNLLAGSPGKEIPITIERNGQTMTIPVTIDSNNIGGKTTGSLGVTFEITGTKGLSFFDAVKEGIKLTNAYIYGTFLAFKNIFVKRDVSKMGGPLMVISQTVQAAGHSFAVFLFFMAIISINLAVFNLIPLPIVDGGQILHYTIEAIIGRPMPIKMKEYIHIASWVLVMGLMIYLSAQDIYKMIKPFLAKLLGSV